MRILISICLRVLLAATMIVPALGTPKAQILFAVHRGEGVFLVLSDIHFDPFADPRLFPQLLSARVDEWESIFHSSGSEAFSQYRSDSNYALLMASLKAAQQYGSKRHYDYVVVTGDYLAHDFQEKFHTLTGGKDDDFPSFVIKTMTFVSRMIQHAFPALPIYGSLGNNDSICGDYRLTPGGPFLASVAEEWRVVASNPQASHDFATGGYYALSHPMVPKHELIVLNSTFWSTLYQNACSQIPGNPGAAELDWFNQKLQQLRYEKKKASLIMHIPPGIDGYNSARTGSCGPVVSMWKQDFAASFLQIVQTYRDVLRDGYAGHMHMDDLRVLADTGGAPFLEMHIVPAISPIYNNNPAFEIGLYNKKNGGLLDYAIIYLANLSDFKEPSQKQPMWSVEYTVDSGYHIAKYGPAGAKKIVEAIRSDEKTRAQYIQSYAVQSPKPPSVTEKNWLSYSCAQTELAPDSFSKCSCKSASNGK